MNLSIDTLRTLIAQSGQQELIITMICIIGIIIALANCFAGYRLLSVWLILLGIGLGAVCGYSICSIFNASTIVQAVVILIAALVFALLAHHFKTLGSFLLCTGMTFSVAYYFLFFTLGYANIKGHTMIAAIISILCGLLSHLVKKPVIILITAACGAYTAFSTACSLLDIWFSQQLYWIIIAFLALSGAITQFLRTKRK